MSHSIGGILVAGKLSTLQKLIEDAFPESFDLTQGHGVVRTRPDMLDPVLDQFLFEPGGRKWTPLTGQPDELDSVKEASCPWCR